MMKRAMTAVLALAAAGAAPGAAHAQRMVQGGPGANFPRPMAGQMPMGRPPMQGQVQHQAQFQQQFQRQNQFQQQNQFQRQAQFQQQRQVQQQAQFQRQNQFQQTRVVQNGGGRWGSKVGGRWWGGANAPGGWGAYHTPQRGWRLPSYWVAPRFYINDWSNYGFTAPSQGYYWTRYYDDAVLIDGRGDVYDTVSGVDWDRYDGRYDDGVPAAYDDGCYDERADRKRRDRKGVGGAVAGAVVGGIAGNVIAGRGNRLGGTLIGGGLGAAAGYAIGSRNDGRRGCAPVYDGGYREPLPPPPPPPPVYDDRGYDHGPGPRSWTSADGATTVTVTTGGGAPVFYAPPTYGYGNVTTVTVQSAPVVTTTTTEIVEDRVTWTKPVVRRVYKRAWRPQGKTLCRCR